MSRRRCTPLRTGGGRPSGPTAYERRNDEVTFPSTKTTNTNKHTTSNINNTLQNTKYYKHNTNNITHNIGRNRIISIKLINMLGQVFAHLCCYFQTYLFCGPVPTTRRKFLTFLTCWFSTFLNIVHRFVIVARFGSPFVCCFYMLSICPCTCHHFPTTC